MIKEPGPWQVLALYSLIQLGALMKNLFVFMFLMALGTGFATAKESEKETKEDIAKHRTMAAAHEAAAKCREAGKGEDVCNKELQAACKGIAIGKFCGLKHEH
jgi:hypothetical protein